MTMVAKIREALKQVDAFSLTVRRKAHHKYVALDMKDLYMSFCSINPILFNAEREFYWLDYKKSIELGMTKKELDHRLKLCKLYLEKHLHMILDYELSQRGEE